MISYYFKINIKGLGYSTIFLEEIKTVQISQNQYLSNKLNSANSYFSFHKTSDKYIINIKMNFNERDEFGRYGLSFVQGVEFKIEEGLSIEKILQVFLSIYYYNKLNYLKISSTISNLAKFGNTDKAVTFLTKFIKEIENYSSNHLKSILDYNLIIRNLKLKKRCKYFITPSITIPEETCMCLLISFLFNDENCKAVGGGYLMNPEEYDHLVTHTPPPGYTDLFEANKELKEIFIPKPKRKKDMPLRYFNILLLAMQILLIAIFAYDYFNTKTQLKEQKQVNKVMREDIDGIRYYLIEDNKHTQEQINKKIDSILQLHYPSEPKLDSNENKQVK